MDLESQEILTKDADLNADFDQLLKQAAAPKIKKERVEKRQRGRPKAGRIVFQQSRIDKLPKFGHLSAFARLLNIKHTTLQQWCALKNHPLPCVERDGHKIFRKDVLVKWLVATKRFSLKPEYTQE